MNVEITVKPTLVCPMLVRNIKDNSIGLKALDCSIVILKSSTCSIGFVDKGPLQFEIDEQLKHNLV